MQSPCMNIGRCGWRTVIRPLKSCGNLGDWIAKGRHVVELSFSPGAGHGKSEGGGGPALFLLCGMEFGRPGMEDIFVVTFSVQHYAISKVL